MLPGRRTHLLWLSSFIKKIYGMYALARSQSDLAWIDCSFTRRRRPMCRVSFHEINGYVSVGTAITAVSSRIINKSVVSPHNEDHMIERDVCASLEKNRITQGCWVRNSLFSSRNFVKRILVAHGWQMKDRIRVNERDSELKFSWHGKRPEKADYEGH